MAPGSCRLGWGAHAVFSWSRHAPPAMCVPSNNGRVSGVVQKPLSWLTAQIESMLSLLQWLIRNVNLVPKRSQQPATERVFPLQAHFQDKVGCIGRGKGTVCPARSGVLLVCRPFTVWAWKEPHVSSLETQLWEWSVIDKVLRARALSLALLTLGVGLFVWGAVLSSAGCSVASLALARLMPVAPLPPAGDNEKCLQTLSNVLGGGGAKLLLAETC